MGNRLICVYFKPQRTDAKRLGCVEIEPCTQCTDCAYVAPSLDASAKLSGKAVAATGRRKRANVRG